MKNSFMFAAEVLKHCRYVVIIYVCCLYYCVCYYTLHGSAYYSSDKSKQIALVLVPYTKNKFNTIDQSNSFTFNQSL